MSQVDAVLLDRREGVEDDRPVFLVNGVVNKPSHQNSEAIEQQIVGEDPRGGEFLQLVVLKIYHELHGSLKNNFA